MDSQSMASSLRECGLPVSSHATLIGLSEQPVRCSGVPQIFSAHSMPLPKLLLGGDAKRPQ